MSSIYKITNIITNKEYIGYTSRNINRRFYEHKWEALNREENNNSSYLYESMRKYGTDCFVIEEIFAFDEKDYDLDTILAGDILKVSHTGSMQVALSYPGQVKLSNGKITNIEKIESIKVFCSVYQVPGEDENYREVVSDDKNINFFILIINYILGSTL